MNVQRLNSSFGAPGRIVFREGFAGYPNVVIANQYGSAEIALLGANVLSYRPTGHSDVLFRPARRDGEYNRGDSFHGGIPVCWPQFGNRFSRDLPQHGFARKMVFEVRGTEYTEEKTEMVLGLKSDDETKKLWPHDFDLEYRVSLTMKLNLTLTTRNTGKEPFDFNCGFHPYFLVRDRNAVTVRGLAGLEYFDGVGNKAGLRQEGDLVMDHAVDFIYTLPEAPKHEKAVLDAGLRRAVAMVSTGDSRAVVWNPGTDISPQSDLAAEDWRRFVCVEPVSDWPGGRALNPGAEHVLCASVQAHLEGV